MPRVALDLEQKSDLAVIKSDGWRVAQGLEPGEPNQGLVAEKLASEARLPDYDDSSWGERGRFSETLFGRIYVRVVSVAFHHA